MDLEKNLLEVLEETFVGDSSDVEGAVVIGARPVAASMLWNLDGSLTPCCLDFLPLLAREVAPGGAVQRSPLLYLFSMIRLVATVEHQAKGNLAAIDAMLGCPVKLFSLVRVGRLPRWQDCSAASAVGEGTHRVTGWLDRVSERVTQPDPPPLTPPCPASRAQELVDPSRFVNLEPDQQRVVLTGAFYMLNWCRELANTFALQLDPTG